MMKRNDGLQTKPCVLLVNLGSPDEPTSSAVRTYLREFLSDRRVIETHPAFWRPILEGIILRVRPRKSAAKYRLIWGDRYSPLLEYTNQQASSVGLGLGDKAEVRFAMRYGSGSIRDGLDAAYKDGFRRVLVVPLYPQYSATTVASVTDEVYRWALASRDQFELRIARSFAEDPRYIDAMANAIQSHWDRRGALDFAAGDRLLLSYHGIPISMAQDGDPYPQECEETTEALVSKLGLTPGQVLHCYQSKFGPAKWLGPATIDTVRGLPALGAGRVDVVCPGFTSDCLETLEEIDMENRAAFEQAGGKEFNYIPWGNSEDAWLKALAAQVDEALAGWI